MECFGWSRRELLEQRQRLEALARQLVADEHRAQDLVQETLLASLRVSGRAIRAPAAWMAQLLRRRALQVRREEERRRLRHERGGSGWRQRDDLHGRQHKRGNIECQWQPRHRLC